MSDEELITELVLMDFRFHRMWGITGEPRWVYNEYISYDMVGKRIIYRKGESCIVKRNTTSIEYIKKFIEVLDYD